MENDENELETVDVNAFLIYLVGKFGPFDDTLESVMNGLNELAESTAPHFLILEPSEDGSVQIFVRSE